MAERELSRPGVAVTNFSCVSFQIKLHSHAVCDEMRGLQLSLASESNIAATSPLKGSAQTSLDHALEECTQAVFLVGEGDPHFC